MELLNHDVSIPLLNTILDLKCVYFYLLLRRWINSYVQLDRRNKLKELFVGPVIKPPSPPL